MKIGTARELNLNDGGDPNEIVVLLEDDSDYDWYDNNIDLIAKVLRSVANSDPKDYN